MKERKMQIVANKVKMEDEAYLEKLETEVDDLKIALISTNDFIKNKQATGRAKDLGDIESLKRQ